ncbi:MAG: HlyD family efflux transporter periplasmic adaptor subunit [Bacteroidota bacterium]
MKSLTKILLPLLFIGAIGAGVYFFTQGDDKKQANELTTTVQKGEFKIHVNATGELQAKESTKIRGPQGMRSVQIYQTTISDMVAEGTVVKKGDYVASLDQTELSTKMKEAQTQVDGIMTQLEQAKIDTAIELRGIRDQLINLKFSMEEKKLQVEQSKFEPQMIIRQAEIDLERSERDLKQLEQKYTLTQTKSNAKISEILNNLQREQIKVQRMVDIAGEFTVKAPNDGMVIYARSWNGKIGPGSQVSTWDPVVAELPDLTDMVSKTYVNEVDISKVQKGQEVQIKVDAFPDEDYTGHVIQVANVGEELRGYDAKVFEVIIQMHQSDSILRPAMTTSNEVLTHIFEEVMYIPLESLHTDSLSFVYKKVNSNFIKQEVLTSESNDNEVIVELGLEVGDEVLLSMPDNGADFDFAYLGEAEKKEFKEKLDKEKRERQAEAMERASKVKGDAITSETGGGRVIFRIN